MGLGIVEILILLLVLGGVVAWRQRPAARKWIVGGLGGVVACLAMFTLILIPYAMRSTQQAQIAETQQKVAVWNAQAEEAVAQYRAQIRRIKDVEVKESQAAVTAPRPGDEAKAAPEWMTEELNDPHRVIVVSAQYANKVEASFDALNKATNVVLAEYQKTHGSVAGGLDAANVKSNAIRNQHTQEIIRTAGDHQFTVYRTYLLVDTSPSVMSNIEQIVQNKTRGIHQTRVVIGAIALTAIMALLAGFFRLDDRTRGRYRLPLVGATFSGIALLTIAVPVLAIRCAEGGHPFCGGSPADPATIQEAVPTEAPRPANIEPWRDPVMPPQPENPHRLIKYSHERTPGSTDCPLQSPWH